MSKFYQRAIERAEVIKRSHFVNFRALLLQEAEEAADKGLLTFNVVFYSHHEPDELSDETEGEIKKICKEEGVAITDTCWEWLSVGKWVVPCKILPPPAPPAYQDTKK